MMSCFRDGFGTGLLNREFSFSNSLTKLSSKEDCSEEVMVVNSVLIATAVGLTMFHCWDALDSHII